MKKDDMNIWWAMWWFAVIVFLSGVFCTLTGCVASTELPAPAEPGRFEITYSQYFLGADYVHIIRDHDTDDEYLFFKSGYGGGLALMPEKTVEEETFTVTERYLFEAAPPAPELEPAEVEKEPLFRSLGEFIVTAYCPCVACSEEWGDMTATGVRAKEGRTIAVDPKVIPYGTVVYFDGADGLMGGYVAEDCGGAINGNDIDIYFDSHEEAQQWGVKLREVFVLEGSA